MTAPDHTLLQSIPQGSTPVPDPTARTTDAVRGAVEQLRLDIAAQHDLARTRLDAMDQAVARQLAHLRDLLDVRLTDASTLDAAERTVLMARLDGLNRLLDERHGTQTLALAAAVESQQTAMRTALAAADTAVTAALTAAEKAVDKAEKAAEKRFDAVNEFRSQLADQAQTFMPRSESEARVTALTEKVNTATAANAERIRQIELRLQVLPTVTEREAVNAANLAFHTAVSERVNALELRITAQLQQTAGRSAGVNAGWVYLLGAIGAIGTIISVVVLLLVK